MDNMEIYEKVRAVPSTALKPIKAGRLKGMSDINPMWRIKMLTELFGPVGFGWYYEILEERLEKSDNGEVKAFVKINLFINVNDKWSKPIQGVGGSSFVANESKGPYVNDECFKMAFTDALGIACKALGFAGNVYYEKDRTKYTNDTPSDTKEERIATPEQIEVLLILASKKGLTSKQVTDSLKKREVYSNNCPIDVYNGIYASINKMPDKEG